MDLCLDESAVQNGLDLYLNTLVTSIEKQAGSGYRILTDKGPFITRYLINAAGLGVDEIARMVGDDDFNLILTKGVMVILDKSVSHLVHNMVYGTYGLDHSQLIAPTSHGNVLAGLGYFTIPANKEDTAVSREKLQEGGGMSQCPGSGVFGQGYHYFICRQSGRKTARRRTVTFISLLRKKLQALFTPRSGLRV
jgi:L-2-hydroxyglutarate oxidase LhgO